MQVGGIWKAGSSPLAILLPCHVLGRSGSSPEGARSRWFTLQENVLYLPNKPPGTTMSPALLVLLRGRRIKLKNSRLCFYLLKLVIICSVRIGLEPKQKSSAPFSAHLGT